MIESYMKFHKKFKFPEPKKFDLEHVEMRLNFLLEELKETGEAAGYRLEVLHTIDGDKTRFIKDKSLTVKPADFLDGLVDLLYVVLGTAAMTGLMRPYNGAKKFFLAFCDVHAANMKKVRVKSAKESLRKTIFDLKKPKGWKKPDLEYLIK